MIDLVKAGKDMRALFRAYAAKHPKADKSRLILSAVATWGRYVGVELISFEIRAAIRQINANEPIQIAIIEKKMPVTEIEPVHVKIYYVDWTQTPWTVTYVPSEEQARLN